MNAQEAEAAGGQTAGSAARGHPEYAAAASKSSGNFDGGRRLQNARVIARRVRWKDSLFAVELRKLLLQAGNLRQIVDLDVGTIQVMLQVVLVIAFSGTIWVTIFCG